MVYSSVRWPDAKSTSEVRDFPPRAIGSPLHREHDDLARNVYCLLGMPVDAVDLPTALGRIKTALAGRRPFLLSTPNLNFLINSIADPAFRESLMLSDLCPADGIAIVVIARLLGIPIKERVAGSDMFESLKSVSSGDQPVRVFLFGGEDDVAETAAIKLNAQATGLTCVGALNPGHGTVEEMSSEAIIDAINSTDAQFLIASLGAQKGQAWLVRNHSVLQAPVRAHLGAALNFQAGAIHRAPPIMRKLGLEWLWRIKEEPYLWRRYAHDALVLLRLLSTRIMPLVLESLWQEVKLGLGFEEGGLLVAEPPSDEFALIKLSGVASARDIEKAITAFDTAVRGGKPIVLDMEKLRFVDNRFLGLLLMLRKQGRSQGVNLRIVRLSGRVARIFRLNGLTSQLGLLVRAGDQPDVKPAGAEAVLTLGSEVSRRRI